MNEQGVKILVCLAIALALIGMGAGCAWEWQANKYTGVIQSSEAARQADLTLVATAAANQSRQALAKQQASETKLAEIDTKAQKDKTDALDKNKKLAAAVADGTRRLRISGSCTATLSSGSKLPDSASAAGVGDAGTVELSPATGSAVLSIRAGIIADQTALKALQAYVTNVCQQH